MVINQQKLTVSELDQILYPAYIYGTKDLVKYIDTRINGPQTPKFPKKLPGTIWGITSYFNPAKYKVKYQNYKKFREESKRQGLKLITVELSFSEDGSFELEEGDADKLIQIKGGERNILWQKEALLNIALKNLPDDCDKVIWTDCDLVFHNDSWVEDTAKLLEEYNAVHPFSSVVFLPEEIDSSDKLGSIEIGISETTIMHSLGRGISHFGPEMIREYRSIVSGLIGYAWSIRRELIDDIGFFDQMILGGGDSVMAHAFYGVKWRNPSVYVTPDALKEADAWCEEIYPKVQGSVHYSPGLVDHLWHGTRKNRRYFDRWRVLETMDHYKDISKNSDGIFEWATHAKEFQAPVKKYFHDRQEIPRLQITILMPYYNKKQYIVKGVQSLLKQTDRNWKLIICDDCSDPEEYNFLCDYIEDLADPRIKVIKNPKNLGLQGTLKRLIDESETDLVGTLDADDALVKDAIREVRRAYIADPELSFTYSGQYLCDEWLTPRHERTSKQISEKVSFLQQFLFFSFRTFKKSMYYKTPGYDDKYLYADDNDISYKFEEAGKGRYIQKPLYLYRFLPDSMTRHSVRQERARISQFQAMFDALARRGSKNAIYGNVNVNRLKHRVTFLRAAERGAINGFGLHSLFEYLYCFFNYRLFKRRIKWFQKSKKVDITKNYPAKFEALLNKKDALISFVKSEHYKFAFLNIKGNAYTYLVRKMLAADWKLPINELEDHIIQDLIGYRHDGDYKVECTDKEKLGPEYTKFAVYRDPVERILSFFEREAGGIQNLDMKKLNFIEKHLKSNWKILDLGLIPQSYYLKDAELDCLVELDSLNKFLKEKFGIQELAHPEKPRASKVNKELIDRIKSIYAADYQISNL